jgi:hypothetical protein
MEVIRQNGKEFGQVRLVQWRVGGMLAVTLLLDLFARFMVLFFMTYSQKL